MNRVWHPYTKWEDYPAGFYDTCNGQEKEEKIKQVVEFFNDEKKVDEFMNRAAAEWVFSFEHNLTNNSMNKIAYIGQAACCLYNGIPSTVTMEAWSLLDKSIQERANEIAEKTLKKWEGYYAKT